MHDSPNSIDQFRLIDQFPFLFLEAGAVDRVPRAVDPGCRIKLRDARLAAVLEAIFEKAPARSRDRRARNALASRLARVTDDATIFWSQTSAHRIEWGEVIEEQEEMDPFFSDELLDELLPTGARRAALLGEQAVEPAKASWTLAEEVAVASWGGNGPGYSGVIPITRSGIGYYTYEEECGFLGPCRTFADLADQIGSTQSADVGWRVNCTAEFQLGPEFQSFLTEFLEANPAGIVVNGQRYTLNEAGLCRPVPCSLLEGACISPPVRHFSLRLED
jgi:hypothetical protein